MILRTLQLPDAPDRLCRVVPPPTIWERLQERNDAQGFRDVLEGAVVLGQCRLRLQEGLERLGVDLNHGEILREPENVRQRRDGVFVLTPLEIEVDEQG